MFGDGDGDGACAIRMLVARKCVFCGTRVGAMDGLFASGITSI